MTTNYMRTGLMAIAMLLGLAWLSTQAPAQQAPAPAGARGQAAQGRGAGRGQGPARKRVLAWADSRNGKAQHEYVSYALAQLQRIGHDSKAYDVIIRTDSDIISFNPKMTDGKTPASGGPSLSNIDAILFAGHRNVPLDAQQKKDLISAIHDKGIGFVSLFIGMLPNDDFPEMANILGEKPASVDVHDPWSGGSTFINESPDSPFTRHLPKVWELPNASVYQPDFYNRADIQVLLRKDLSKLAPNADYTRTDGDYPVAWTKMYGKGRVFVSSIGNNEALWDNPDLLKMYDEAIKWSLGMTQYDVKPHPLPADVRGPQGSMPASTPARGGGRGARGAGAVAQGTVAPGTVAQNVRVDPNTPTEEQWNKPLVQAYVAKAKALAGNDPDLQYDFNFNCTVSGTHIAGGGGARMTVGDGAYLDNASKDPKVPFIEMPEKTTMLPPQRVFDNLWRFGSTGVGAWLVTTPNAYILFDTLNNEDEARDVIIGGMKKVGLDPAKIKYVIFGHFHLDHTGGGRYIQQLLHVPVYMGRDDWPLYIKAVSSTEGQGARLKDHTPMERGHDIEDGMKLTIGDTTATFIVMPGHTPGSAGMIFPAKYQGKTHNVLITTASAGGDNVRNRESFIGGFEHIWNWAEKEKVESVLNAHLNYNINTLSRMTYVADHYPPAKNPMLYGVEKTHNYIEITRACAQARLEALGW